MSDIQLFNGEVNQHENTKNYNNGTVFGQLACVDEWHCPREGAKWCCEGLHCVKRHILSHITSTPLYHDLVINCFFLMWHYTGSKSQLLISPTVTLFHHDSASTFRQNLDVQEMGTFPRRHFRIQCVNQKVCFLFKCHWCVSPRVQLAISQFWLGIVESASDYLNQLFQNLLGQPLCQLNYPLHSKHG